MIFARILGMGSSINDVHIFKGGGLKNGEKMDDTYVVVKNCEMGKEGVKNWANW